HAAAHPRRLAQHVTDMNDKQYSVRDKAAKELEKLGESAEPALQKAVTANPSAEVRRRAEELLQKLRGPVTHSEMLRAYRSVMVLEEIGTADAQEVLKDLAQGAPEARLTRDAKASLERFAKRPVSAR